MNTEHPHRKFYYTLFEYILDTKKIPPDIIGELKNHFYIEKVEFPQRGASTNTYTLFVYYLDETIFTQYQEVLELITILLGCENLITINMDNDHNLETIQTMNYKVFLEIMYLRGAFQKE